MRINGPLSTHPDTYIWIRSATLDFYRPGRLEASQTRDVKLEVDRKDPALSEILPDGAKLERVADGFTFTEGPLWIPGRRDGDELSRSQGGAGSGGTGGASFGPDAAGGFLLFSDPNNNVVYRMTPAGEVSVFLAKSGYSGEDIGEYGQPGSNGLSLDPEGRLVLCQHGNRRVVRIERNGRTTVLADRFEGRRLNSPNDLVHRSDGTLYFTDPPFGLPKFSADPRREQDLAGVYAVRQGKVLRVATDFSGPNGLAFSPDEQFLYVGNWDEKAKVVFRYAVHPDGTLGPGRLFFDMTRAPGEDAIDGIKVDRRGNVYVSGPGGLWVLSPEGRHLGTLHGPEHPHNFAWGDADGRSLYLAAQTGIYRVRLNVAGSGLGVGNGPGSLAVR